MSITVMPKYIFFYKRSVQYNKNSVLVTLSSCPTVSVPKQKQVSYEKTQHKHFPEIPLSVKFLFLMSQKIQTHV